MLEVLPMTLMFQLKYIILNKIWESVILVALIHESSNSKNCNT